MNNNENPVVDVKSFKSNRALNMFTKKENKMLFIPGNGSVKFPISVNIHKDGSLSLSEQETKNQLEA